jgi:hypothetical protein
MYKEHLLYEINKMCPTDEGYTAVEVHPGQAAPIREKRAIFVIGTLIACVVLCAGAGTAFGLAVSNNKQAEQMLILLKLL